MINASMRCTQQTFTPERKGIILFALAATASCAAAAESHLDHRFESSPPLVVHTTTVDLATSAVPQYLASDSYDDEYLAGYVEDFNAALAQYTSGETIKIPDDLQSEDEFYEWLKSV